MDREIGGKVHRTCIVCARVGTAVSPGTGKNPVARWTQLIEMGMGNEWDRAPLAVQEGDGVPLPRRKVVVSTEITAPEFAC